MLLYWLCKFILVGPVARMLWRPWVRGLHNVPVTGPAILASNHLAVVDSLFMPLVVSRPVTFPAKSDYFTGSGVKGRLKRAFFFGVGQVPIERTNGATARPALAALEAKLLAGELVGFYPEGTRSPDGRLYRGKTGVARLALATGAPVVPVCMVNTERIQPLGTIFPRLRPRPGVVFGAPLDFSRYEGMAGDRFVERSVTDQIMYELMRLSAQEYVDVYAAKVKAEMARARRVSSAAGSSSTSARRVSRRAEVERTDRAPEHRAS